MSPLWLIVRREVTEKLRSRAFRIVNLMLLALVLAGTILPGILGGDDVDEFRVAAVGDDAAAVLEVAQVQGEGFGLPVEVSTVADEATGRQQVTDGDVDAVLLGGDRLVATRSIGADRLELLDSSRRVVQLDDALAAAGLDEDARSDALSVSPLDVEVVGADGEVDEGLDPVAVAVGFGTVFLLYGLLIFYGQQVAQGLVQEKQSRVIEVLLATVRPIDLLGGKLLGLGLLGLAQIAMLLLAAGIGIQVAGTIDVPASAYGGLAATLPWFVVGYALYATMFALTAAVVPKVEDLQTAMTVPILFLVASIVVAQFAITDPGGAVATIGALIPFSAPIVQPLLATLGESSWPLAIGGALSTIAATAVLVPIAARVHAGAALSTRTRIKVREAFRKNED